MATQLIQSCQVISRVKGSFRCSIYSNISATKKIYKEAYKELTKNENVKNFYRQEIFFEVELTGVYSSDLKRVYSFYSSWKSNLASLRLTEAKAINPPIFPTNLRLQYILYFRASVWIVGRCDEPASWCMGSRIVGS